MADANDALELVDVVEADVPETELIDENVNEPEGDEDEYVIGDGVAPAPAESDTALVRQLREANRESARQLKELRKQIKPVEIGPRPPLADFDYDEDRHAVAVDEWHEAKAQAAKSNAKLPNAGSELVEVLQTARTAYKERLNAVASPDKVACEEAVMLMLSDEQQQALLMASDDPAKVVMALGRNSAALAALAAITNPFKLAGAIAKLEGQIQVKPKRNVPAPEKVATGSGQISTASTTKQEAKLRVDAESSGDYSALMAFRRKQKQA